MENTFELPVTFNGEDLAFKAKLINFGYVRKFEVEVEDKTVVFEQDEEGQYRALQDYSTLGQASTISPALLKEIASVIQSVN